MNWISLAGSLAAVLFVAWLVGRLGLGTAAPIDEATAIRLAEETYIGHRFTAAVVDRDGRGALVEDGDGAVVMLRAHGDKWVARLLAKPARARVEGDALIIPAAENMFGATTLTLGNEAASAWGRKLDA